MIGDWWAGASLRLHFAYLLRSAHAATGTCPPTSRNFSAFPRDFLKSHARFPPSPLREVALPGLPEALSEVTRLPVALADPFATVGFAKNLDEAALRSRSTDLTVALGLALGSAA